MTTNDNDLHCSFCGREKSEVGKLIAGTDGYICNEVYRALPQYVRRQW